MELWTQLQLGKKLGVLAVGGEARRREGSDGDGDGERDSDSDRRAERVTGRLRCSRQRQRQRQKQRQKQVHALPAGRSRGWDLAELSLQAGNWEPPCRQSAANRRSCQTPDARRQTPTACARLCRPALLFQAPSTSTCTCTHTHPPAVYPHAERLQLLQHLARYNAASYAFITSSSSSSSSPSSPSSIIHHRRPRRHRPPRRFSPFCSFFFLLFPLLLSFVLLHRPFYHC
jgi:hypothetical protein